MATKKISLFDATQNILVELDVSAAEAKRAATDPVFAKLLLDGVLNVNRQPDAGGTSNVTNEDVHDTEDTGYFNLEDLESEAALVRWSPPCVLLLLETYRTLQKDLDNGKLSQKCVWEKVAKQLKEKGYDATGPQCSSKLRSLKKTYKSIMNHSNKSGNDRRTWPHFNIMREILTRRALAKKARVNQVSATRLNKQAKHNDSMNKSAPKFASIIRKKIKQKEEYEDEKMERHRKRMEKDEKFLKVLEELANK